MKRLILRQLFSRVDACLAISTLSRRFYEDYGVESGKIFMTPYSVDNDFFMNRVAEARAHRSQIRESLGIPGDIPLILQTSKLIPRKRPFDLLQAVEHLDRAAALVFVGDGVLRPALEDYARSRRLTNVFFIGFRNQSELPPLYAAADIFVMPSGHDIFGAAINEAMCAALPIVATDAVGATVDLVREGENGMIYPAADVDALTQRLRTLVERPADRVRMGARSKEIISDWNYDACVLGIVGALDRIGAKHGTGRSLT